MSKNFLLFDGHALIYRAYHAFPPLNTPSGQLVNAVYGFTRILLTVLNRFEPDYVAVAFDHPKKTFRHQAYEAYKANRVEMPDDLKPQIELVKTVVKSLNIPQFEKEGYEADDLIGTLAKQASQLEDLMTIIVTGDKDLLQLVGDSTHVFIPKRGQRGEDTEYDSATVEQKMGIRPDQVIDLKALMGDASDNVPGVKGVGRKTALKLITRFESITGLYRAIEKLGDETDPLLKGAALERLKNDKGAAFQSRELVTINTHAPVQLKLDDCRVTGYDKEKALELFRELGFRSMVKLLPADDFEVGVQGALF